MTTIWLTSSCPPQAAVPSTSLQYFSNSSGSTNTHTTYVNTHIQVVVLYIKRSKTKLCPKSCYLLYTCHQCWSWWGTAGSHQHGSSCAPQYETAVLSHSCLTQAGREEDYIPWMFVAMKPLIRTSTSASEHFMYRWPLCQLIFDGSVHAVAVRRNLLYLKPLLGEFLSQLQTLLVPDTLQVLHLGLSYPAVSLLLLGSLLVLKGISEIKYICCPTFKPKVNADGGLNK